jgi:hypothetical protein
VVRPQGWEKSGAARPSTRPFPIAFLYWGRRGALPRFTLDLAQALIARPDTDIHISISYQNELFAHYAWLGDRLLPI